MPASTETVTTAHGVEQHRRHWPAEGPARAAMVIVHGMSEHSGRYEHIGGHFAKSGIDVRSFDLRGHGLTAGPRGYVGRFDEFLDDVEEHLDLQRELGLPVILLGHSLGGLICASYAVSDRPQPDLLVLSAPALSANVPGWQKTMAPIMAAVLPKLTMPSDFDGELLSRDPAVGTAYKDDPLRLRKATTRLGAEVFKAMTTVARDRRRIRVPTYVLHGADDNLVPPSASEPLVELENVTRVVHAGLRHECMNEPEQDEVLASISAWLDGRLDALGPRA